MKPWKIQGIEFTKEDIKEAMKSLDDNKYDGDSFTTNKLGNEYNFESPKGNLYGPKRIFECICKNQGKEIPDVGSTDNLRRHIEDAGFTMKVKNKRENTPYETQKGNDMQQNNIDNIVKDIKLTEGNSNDETTFPRNQILYGPPGTGKTYNTIVKAMSIIDGIEYECCETNQSDDEKINHKKPTLEEYLEWYEKNKRASTSTINGEYSRALKKYDESLSLFDVSNDEDFSEYLNKIKNTEKYKDNLKTSDNNIANFETITGAYLEFYADWENSLKAVSYKDLQTKFQEELEKKNNDKTKKIEFITFHQSYSYEEFVEGIKPEIDWSETEEKYEAKIEGKDNNKPVEEKKSNEIKYVGEWGIFRQICYRAEHDSKNNYVLIIDEINRGNISKIFGELITLIEDDKRENVNNDTSIEYHTIKTILPYSGDSFSVPNNLYIIGTMNTSDRSIASVDIALRRRFKFKEMMPKSNVMDETIKIEKIDGYKDKKIELRKLFDKLNQRIYALLDRDHQIGHSYFIGVKDVGELKDVWFDNVIPLLNEYFYGDWDKLKAILGDVQDNAFIKATGVSEGFFAVKNTDVFDSKEFYEFVKKEDFDNEKFIKALENAFNGIVTENKPKDTEPNGGDTN